MAVKQVCEPTQDFWIMNVLTGCKKEDKEVVRSVVSWNNQKKMQQVLGFAVATG